LLPSLPVIASEIADVTDPGMKKKNQALALNEMPNPQINNNADRRFILFPTYRY